MQQLHNTIVLTGSIRSGKSTALRAFLKDKKNAGGFLSPDIEDKRKLLFLKDGSIHAFEALDGDAEDTLAIGRFHFRKSTFEKAQALLQQPLAPLPHWWVADEIGPLELDNKGFEPAFGFFLSAVEQQNLTCLMVVVREKLLPAFEAKYGIPSAVIHSSVLDMMRETTGVVLCGGKSTRMGSPKALLCYHGDQPQYRWLAGMMGNVFNTILIAKGHLDIPDDPSWTLVSDEASDQGPAAGVLAAFQAAPQNHLFVCGCDYPMVRLSDFVRLIAEGNETLAVCYADESSAFVDPLVCFYHKSCLPLMMEWYAQGNRSLRHFLQTIPHKVLTPLDSGRLASIDDPVSFQNLTNRLHGSH